MAQTLVQAEVAFNLGLIDTRQRRQAEVIQDQVVELVRNNNWRVARNMSDALLKFITQASGEDQRLPLLTGCWMNVKILRLIEQLYLIAALLGWEQTGLQEYVAQEMRQCCLNMPVAPFHMSEAMKSEKVPMHAKLMMMWV